MNDKIYHINEECIPNSFCDKIINNGESQTIEQAKLAYGNNANRSSKISWIRNADKELQKTLNHFVQFSNKESKWNYSITAFESLQYTIYNEGDFYNWHVDQLTPYENNTIRKLSFTLCLNDDYEGGDFEICNPHPIPEYSTTTTFKLQKGDMIVFPSHIWHRVKPVTKGVRKSLVGWVVGNV